jgi:hypothetical protein
VLTPIVWAAAARGKARVPLNEFSVFFIFLRYRTVEHFGQAGPICTRPREYGIRV